MSRPRFLADHDLNDHIVDGILRRQPSVEFTRARDIGIDRFPDPDLLEYAAKEGLIVVSHDVNTMPAHANQRLAAGLSMPGLLMVQQTSPVRKVIDDLEVIWASSESEEWQRQIWFLPF